MRRQQLLRAASAQNLCVACACRLAAEFTSVQAAPLPSIVSRSQRHFNTKSQQKRSENVPVRDGRDGRYGTGQLPWAGTDAGPGLSPAEQVEKANRLRQLEQQRADSQRIKLNNQSDLDQGRREQVQTPLRKFYPEEEILIQHTTNTRQPAYPESEEQPNKISHGRHTGQKRLVLNRSDGSASRAPTSSKKSDSEQLRFEENQSLNAQTAPKGSSLQIETEAKAQPHKYTPSQYEQTQKHAELSTKSPERVAIPDFRSASTNQLKRKLAGSAVGWGTGRTETKPLRYGEPQETDRPSIPSNIPTSNTQKDAHDTATAASSVPLSAANETGEEHIVAYGKATPGPMPTQIPKLAQPSLFSGGFPAPRNSDSKNALPPTSPSKQWFGLESDGSYAITPLKSGDFLKGTNPSDDGLGSDWQHLRRQKTMENEPDNVKANSQQRHQFSNLFLDEAAVDRSFEEHRRKREAATSPPSPDVITESGLNDRFKIFGSQKASNRCGRCGQTGHIASQCPRLTKIRCHACGQLGHLANQCPSSDASRDKHSRSRSQLTDPFAKESAEPLLESSQHGTRASVSDSAENNAKPQDYTFRRVNPTVHHLVRRITVDKPAVEKTSSNGSIEVDHDRQLQDAQRVEVDEESKRGGRVSRREQWADSEAEVDGYDKSSHRRGQRNNRRREFDEDEDEEGFARDQARARKQARQVKKDAERKAARFERETRKAEQTTPIALPEFVSVQNLSQLLGVRYEEFVERLEELGYDDVFPGKVLNTETSGMIAMEYNFEPTFDVEAREEEERDLKARPEVDVRDFLPARPSVVTIMGHVDHGKTTILDYLRNSSVAAGEAGGITQHIGAFSVPLASSGKTITFLDTPGHAAFLAMRQRGAIVTDIVVLVVAADDSVKPQTLEAIKHAKAAGVPIIVAINKIDKAEADVQRCKQDLARHGVEIEDFGGDTQVVEVSGKTGKGMDDLEETIVTLSEILDHRAEIDGDVEGWILEATTRKAGRVATVLVRRGTLRPGHVIVAGKTWARVKTLKNEGGSVLDQVGPGMPVEVDGWKDQPTAGDEVLQAPGERKAVSVVEYRLEKAERDRAARDMDAINESRRLEQEKREREKAVEAALRNNGDDTNTPPTSNMEEPVKTSGPIEVPFVIKADVSGSAEAVSAYILSVSSPLIVPKVLYSAIGAINESDIELASVAQGHIISFNLKPDPEMNGAAEARGVNVLENNIIYRVLDDVKALMEEKLPPTITQKVVGEAEVAASFEISLGGRKKATIAGCKVRNGVIPKGCRVRVIRNGEKVYDGTIESLKNVKKDVQEMRKGSECGIGIEGFETFEIGDQIQTYREISEKVKL